MLLGQGLNWASRSIPIILTGHSLGGGLAMAAAYQCRRPAIVFNTAYLNLNGITIPHGARPQPVDAYDVDGDPVTFLQNTMRVVIGLPLNSALAKPIGHVHVLPDADIPGQGWQSAIIDRHAIKRVERDISDEEIVLKCR